MNPLAREMSDQPVGHMRLNTSATLGGTWPHRRP